ncbi:hypothetical protein COT97_04515 [Candidatus Falkowbacteria bacterium CG10_big_fil_rev_8_21_14_0_10_39_11]|uniref:Peptidoglycan bridge formation protein FemAB n=1 Tax=Candidatus Falkowbacteria bacterium CG10_big_fil_rev_8_21_14_0_10_39_11 TaxID=1974565 RepID=A0A2H0V3Z2_9BACT|nr:MAG: hypothetical protein COT97_04515 [Candidatus Falkowbacteria bacterium CG10_big_fil_rev_8_21_14_0_10_39_11]
MKIKHVQFAEKETWNTFVADSAMGSFLQTYDWGELQEKLGYKVWRLVVTERSEWLAVISFYKIKLKLGQSMLYAPKGPVLITNKKSQINKKEVFELLTHEINKVAKQEKVLSFELDPETNDPAWVQILEENDFLKTKMDAQPRHTLILDLTKTEAEIIANMHSKTRYNIRLAGKKGVTVTIDNDRFKDFWDLLKKTEARQNINMQQESYFKHLLQLPLVKLYLAEKDGKVIAANIMIFCNKTAIYLFGSSDYEYRNIMAPHLLQWQAIKDARDSNFAHYDFWGAAPKDANGREQNWGGFTRFKMGFSPDADITEYIGTFEKIYKPGQLGVYRILQNIKSH